MIDEPKEPPKAAEGGRAAAQKPGPGAGGTAPAGKPEPTAQQRAATPTGGQAASAAPSKPPSASPRPPAPPKPPVKPEPWSNPLLDELGKRFPGAVSEAVIFRNMPSLLVPREQILAICQFLNSDEGGAYDLLTDETAVDYPKREKRFDVVYHLYSFKNNVRLRLKLQVGEGEKVPSVTGIWPTANWLEREIYDMFGILYEGHPDLKRLLLPDEWVGHPLRKDYDILRQDPVWVKQNLGVESGQ